MQNYVGRPGKSQVLATSTTSAQSATTFNPETKVVRLVATVATNVDFLSTAGAATLYLPPNVPEYFWMNGFTHVNAVVASGTGSLYITEFTH